MSVRHHARRLAAAVLTVGLFGAASTAPAWAEEEADPNVEDVQVEEIESEPEITEETAVVEETPVVEETVAPEPAPEPPAPVEQEVSTYVEPEQPAEVAPAPEPAPEPVVEQAPLADPEPEVAPEPEPEPEPEPVQEQETQADPEPEVEVTEVEATVEETETEEEESTEFTTLQEASTEDESSDDTSEEESEQEEVNEAIQLEPVPGEPSTDDYLWYGIDRPGYVGDDRSVVGVTGYSDFTISVRASLVHADGVTEDLGEVSLGDTVSIPDGAVLTLTYTVWPVIGGEGGDSGSDSEPDLRPRIYTYTFEGPEGPDEEVIVVTPIAPIQDGNVVTVPSLEGVDYSEASGSEVVVPEDGLPVSALPAEGYTFPDDAITEWFFDYIPSDEDDEDSTDDDQLTVVTPEAPERDGNTVTIPDVEGVDYGYESGSEVEVPEDGLEVNATPEDGYEFPSDATARWEYDYISSGDDDEGDEDDQLTVVTPEAPERDGNTVTIPDIEGVDYGHESGDEVDIPEDGLTVEATPEKGYTFPEDATTEWEYDYIASKDKDEPVDNEDDKSDSDDGDSDSGRTDDDSDDTDDDSDAVSKVDEDESDSTDGKAVIKEKKDESGATSSEGSTSTPDHSDTTDHTDDGSDTTEDSGSPEDEAATDQDAGDELAKTGMSSSQLPLIFGLFLLLGVAAIIVAGPRRA